MPISVAILQDPRTAYCLLVTALIGLCHAAYLRNTLVITFTGTASALLALLAYLHNPPHPSAVLCVGLGFALMNAEFLLPTFGLAGICALAATAYGSWLLLEPSASIELPLAARALLAGAGTLLLFLTVGRVLRRYTLAR